MLCVWTVKSISKEFSSFLRRKGNGNPDNFNKSIVKTRIATSVGIKDTLQHISKTSFTATERRRRRRRMKTVFWCPENQIHIP